MPVKSMSLLCWLQCSKRSSGKLTWPELRRTLVAFFLLLPVGLATSSAPVIVIVSVKTVVNIAGIDKSTCRCGCGVQVQVQVQVQMHSRQ